MPCFPEARLHGRRRTVVRTTRRIQRLGPTWSKHHSSPKTAPSSASHSAPGSYQASETTRPWIADSRRAAYTLDQTSGYDDDVLRAMFRTRSKCRRSSVMPRSNSTSKCVLARDRVLWYAQDRLLAAGNILLPSESWSRLSDPKLEYGMLAPRVTPLCSRQFQAYL